MEYKIGLCVQEIYNGERRKYESSPNANWLQRVVDVRTPVIGSAGLSVGAEFRLITFSDEGTYIVSGITATGGRPNDYFAAWLFIPQNFLVGISGKEIVRWTEKLLEHLREYDGNTKPFQEFFDNELSKIKPDKAFLLPSSASPNDNNASYALRCYRDRGQLEQLISPRFMQQPGDTTYKGVLLMDERNKSVDNKLTELSSEKLKTLTFVSLDPNIPSCIKVKLDDGKELNGQILPYYAGRKINLNFIHEDTRYVPQRSNPIEVDEGDTRIQIPALKWKVRIPLDTFVVVDQEGMPIEKWKITNYAEKNGAIEIEEEKARCLTISFKKEGDERNYQEVSIKANVLEQEKVLVTMPYKTEPHIYEFLEAKGIEIKKEERISEFKSPIPLYKIKEHPESLHRYLYIPIFGNGTFYKLFYRPLLCALLIGFILGLIVMWFIPLKREPVSKQPTEKVSTIYIK